MIESELAFNANGEPFALPETATEDLFRGMPRSAAMMPQFKVLIVAVPKIGGGQ